MINYLVSLVGIRPRSWLGDLNTALPAAALVDIWQWTPFMMLLLLAGLRSLPRDPFEAALIDGASQLRILIQITVPMLSSVITVALLIRTIDTLRIFDQLYILTSGGPGNSTETLSLFVYKAGLKQLRMGYASAVSYLMLIIAIIISTQLLRLTAKRS
jgi:multiple sugar transport system permease protein